jgi:hypothetical protein
MANTKNVGKPRPPTDDARGGRHQKTLSAMMMMMRQKRKNVFVLLAIGFALFVVHPYLRPTVRRN